MVSSDGDFGIFPRVRFVIQLIGLIPIERVIMQFQLAVYMSDSRRSKHAVLLYSIPTTRISSFVVWLQL